MRKFVSLHVDAEKGEGADLAKRYGAHGFPTLVMVDATGEEIDRIVGYLPPTDFVPEVERVLRGEGTIPALRKAVADRPDDLAAAVDLGRKLSAGRPAEGYALLEATAAKAHGKDPALEARALAAFGLAALRSPDADARTRALAALERVVTDLPEAEEAKGALAPLVMTKAQKDPGGALSLLARLRDRTKEHRLDADAELLEASVLVRLAGAALERAAASAQDDPEKLGMLAVTAYRQRLAVRPAVAWARKALGAGKREAPLLDAAANLVQMTGSRREDLEEAVALEKEAVEKATAPFFKADYEATLAKFERALAAAKPGAPAPAHATPAAPKEKAPEKPAEPPAGKPSGKPAPSPEGH